MATTITPKTKNQTAPPRHVYFGPKDPDTGLTQDEPEYEYQEYPRVMYHADGDTIDVNSDEEKDALGPDWSEKKPGPPHAPSQEELRATKLGVKAAASAKEKAQAAIDTKKAK